MTEAETTPTTRGRKERRRRIATAADYATLQFAPLPEAAAAANKWLADAAAQRPALTVALAALAYDDAELAARLAGVGDAADPTAMVDYLREQADGWRAFAAVLDTVKARTLAACHRAFPEECA